MEETYGKGIELQFQTSNKYHLDSDEKKNKMVEGGNIWKRNRDAIFFSCNFVTKDSLFEKLTLNKDLKEMMR